MELACKPLKDGVSQQGSLRLESVHPPTFYGNLDNIDLHNGVNLVRPLHKGAGYLEFPYRIQFGILWKRSW